MIYFEPSDHTYRLDDPINGQLCISATTFIGLFKSDYDVEFWSYYTALRNALGMTKPEFSRHLIVKFKYSFKDVKDNTTEQNKELITEIAYYSGVSPEELLYHQRKVKLEWGAENLKSQKKGTAFHNHKEGEIYSDNGMNYEGIFAKLTEDTDDLSLLHDPEHIVIAPELRMFNRENLVSGSADMVYIYPSKKIDINDWKTNKKISVENKYDKMKYPLQHLDDCNYNHYRLQVSLYAWMLEQWGYTPNSLKFTHVNIDEDNNILDQVEYHTHYMKKEIENMLAYYKQNKELLLSKKK